MGRFFANDVDNYGTSGKSSFFSLKDDGDIARVRFMYNSMEDVEGYAVHKITDENGKFRYVNCLRDYNEPKSKCPFCNSNMPQVAKLYVPLYDEDEQEVKLWERGKTFFQAISSMMSRYSTPDKPLVSHIFEIERHGKKGDTNTTYERFEVGCDDTRLEDLPEVPEVLGSIILDKNADEMEHFLDNGEFPKDGAPVRRNSAKEDDVPQRRTPSRRTEAF